MSHQPKFIVDCADHAGFLRLADGSKTILTRANKSSLKKEDYTKADKGDVLELVDIQSEKSIYVCIESTDYFHGVSEMFSNSAVAYETFGKHFHNENELRAEYEKNRPGYAKLLDNNGVVVWRIKLV